MEAYHGRFYDLYFAGLEGDVEFYVEEALEAGAPVLELGCGTGRILVPTALAGVHIAGLDLSAELLKSARQKLAAADPAVCQNASLIQGDMAVFALDQCFGLITIPYRTFQHLLHPVDQQQALECVRKHLKKDGLLVFNTFDPLRDMAGSGFTRGLQKDTDFIDPVTGNRIVVWYCRDYDPQIQLLEQELIYEEVDERGQVVSRTCGQLVLRYTFCWEMQYLLERCGFALEALYGDFQGGAFPGYGEQIWVARKLG